VIVVGLRQQQRTDTDGMGSMPPSPTTPTFPSSTTFPRPPSSPPQTASSSTSPSLPLHTHTEISPDESDTESIDLETRIRNFRASPESRSPRPDTSGLLRATYGDNWRSHASSLLQRALAMGNDDERERERETAAATATRTERERDASRAEAARLAAEAAETARDANGNASGTRNYVIWVIGGFYPDHMLMTPNVLLGQFDHDDFWALAELLGQVKSPVASKDDIEQSGLQVVKTSQLAEYAEQGKIASNTIDRCLICLSDYEPEEEIRILSCRHGFHKDCVDQWLETGRNNCPACRTKGVSTESAVNPASESMGI